jgi:glycosyltransferase involved in cell wall biosynthesis/GT2 family glycosyltransferase
MMTPAPAHESLSPETSDFRNEPCTPSSVQHQRSTGDTVQRECVPPRLVENVAPPTVAVSIVVLTWNGLAWTKQCLESLRGNTDVAMVEVIVVDNGSTDGTVEYLRSLPWIKPIFNSSNLGYVRGNNAGIDVIEHDRDIILLNNDTVITDPKWIEKLQTSAYKEPDIGIVGCRIRSITGDRLQHAGTYMPDVTFWGQQIAGGERDINQFNADHDVEGVVFACVYLKRKVLEVVGSLDEDYFSYFEDTDYCLKARGAGFRVVNCGALTILHREHASSVVNKVDFNEVFLASQKTFLDKWRDALDARYDIDAVWHSTFSRPLGYAMPSRLLAVALDNAGVKLSYEYLYGSGTVFPVDEPRTFNTGDYRVEVIRSRQPSEGAPRIIFGQADAFDYVKDGYRVGYTMLETTGIPREWARQCNGVDEIWVPTPFNASTFRRSGVTRPIHVMPLGLIDTNYFNPGIIGHPIAGVYTFLSIFEWGERKAPEVLLRAFNKAFRSVEPVVLICKFVNSDPAIDPHDAIRALDLDPQGGRVLLSENERVPYYQLPQLYRSADCFVLPTRGEGWGMPILEAMACGLPVIASYWSAQQHFMTDANSYPLQVDLVPAEAKCPYYAGFKWADPDEGHLVQLLRYVYEHQDEARDKGRRAAREVREKWSLEVTASRLRARLAEISSVAVRDKPLLRNPGMRSPRERRRVGIDVCRAVGHEVTGLGRYTVGLLRGLTRLPDDENPHEYVLFPGFDRFVHPEYGKSVSFTAPDDERITVYRGPLPAFADADRYVSGLALVQCTGNSRPPAIDGPSAVVVYDVTFATHPQFHTDENIRFCAENFEAAIRSDCHFIAISQSTRRDFIAHYGVDEARVSVAPCAVDPREYFPCTDDVVNAVRRKYELPDRYFLYVGSLEPRKNLGLAIRAMERYRGPGVLVVVGASGWLNSSLHDLLVRGGPRIKMLGYVPQADLPALYGGAIATVYPSRYEGFGLPVVESMACGTPVVTSNNSSLAEIATGAAVLLESPDDSEQLCRELEALASDAELVDALRRQGLARAARFTPEACARSTLAIYRELIGEWA